MPTQKKASEHGIHGSAEQPHGKSGHMHNPTGYTDEVAEEEHDFFDRVEREANLKSGGTSGSQSSGQKKGGLESSGQEESSGQRESSGQKKKGGLESGIGQTAQNISQKGQEMRQKAGETMENVKNKAKGTMGMGENVKNKAKGTMGMGGEQK